MHIKLAKLESLDAETKECHDILQNCVHCGFCNAKCPTYQLTGDELDGPRGRIYLMKNILEGNNVGPITVKHLDRCLVCRSCETACPSGVKYGRLLDNIRGNLPSKSAQPILKQLLRKIILTIIPYPKRLSLLVRFVQPFRFLLSRKWSTLFTVKAVSQKWPQSSHGRKILLLQGCVQSELAPEIDCKAAHILDRIGVSLIPVKQGGCCGALNFHLSEHEKAKNLAKTNIDACWKHIEDGVEAILMTATGCTLMVKDYGYLLKDDLQYQKKAKVFSALVKDLSEIIINENFHMFAKPRTESVAFQTPCSLQHGLKIKGSVEKILNSIGYQLVNVENQHLCCGSAGSYSMLQTDMSNKLKKNKLICLEKNSPNLIATANIGCLLHLKTESKAPVKHWVELFENENL